MIIKEKKACFILFFITFFFLAFSSFPAFGLEKRAFTPEDFLKLKRLSDPQISPTAEWVAFVVTQFEPDRTRNSEIWLVSKDSSILGPITRNPGPDSHPRWSPDGKILAFLSRQPKEKYSQIYFYGLKENQTKKITDQKANIRDFK
ncbi:MAG: TolB family protein [Candidatus Aminicenantales bacterium]